MEWIKSKNMKGFFLFFWLSMASAKLLSERMQSIYGVISKVWVHLFPCSELPRCEIYFLGWYIKASLHFCDEREKERD